MDKILNVIGLRVYHNGERKDNITEFTVPDLTLGTSEISGAGILGKLNVPGTGQYNSATFQITYQGSPESAADYMAPGVHSFEFRDAHDVWSSDTGKMNPKSGKYFLTGMMTSAPGGSVQVGNIKSSTVTYEMMRYEYWYEGQQVLLIDKLANRLVVNGTDYSADIDALLD